MNWRIKGVVQGLLSRVPGGVRMNTRLQRTLGNLRDFEGNVDTKVTCDWLILVSHMRDLGVSPGGLDYLEVGTGWYPTLPLCYSLVGARRCYSYDVHRHLDEKLTFRLLRRLEHHLPAIAQGAGVDLQTIRARYREFSQCATLEALLECAGIHYIAPGDASRTSLPDASIDVVFSNSVLEHVPAPSIRLIMEESRRVLRPGGLAIHSANCGDHYAYSDPAITPINYLAYSEASWRKWNNSLLYQNRLRPADFIGLAEASGLAIVLAKQTPQPALLSALTTIKVAPEFLRYDAAELATTSVDFVAQR